MEKPGRASRDPGETGHLKPLHGGRHSISPDLIAHNQRERLLAALATTVAERGYNATTIDQLAEAASVSKRTFYQHFASKKECFLAAYEALDAYIAGMVAEAAEGEEDWSDQVAAAFSALVRFLGSRPNLARVYLVESAVAGEPLVPARDKTTARFIALIEPGRRRRAAETDVAEGIEEGLVGGILTLLARRVVGEEAGDLERFTPAVIEFALAPYLGVDEARQVAARHA